MNLPLEQPQETTIEDQIEALNDQSRVWLYNYLRTFNKTQSARAAGYKDPQNSGRDVYIRLRPIIEHELTKIALTPAEVAARLVAAASFDPIEYINEDGILDTGKMSNDGLGWMISELSSRQIKDDDSGVWKTIYTVKFHNQMRSLETLGKFMGMEKLPSVNITVFNKGYEVVSPDDWDEIENITGDQDD